MCELIYFYLIIWGCVFKGRLFQQEYRIQMPVGQVKPNIITVFDKKTPTPTFIFAHVVYTMK